jgi:rhamnosyltransferase
MKSICLFSSYFNQTEIPYYIRFYLENLLPHFSEIIFITNEKELDQTSLAFLKETNIQLMFVSNEGYDFGMWHKALQKTDVTKYQKIAFVNDSCILFTSLDKFMTWCDNNESDYLGISESNSISKHLQSYFLIVKNKAIPLVTSYFKRVGILREINDVIVNYEVGLSTYLLSEGIQIDAYIKNENYHGEYSPYYYFIYKYLEQGSPVIKKKIVYRSYRKHELFTLARMNFNINQKKYIYFITQLYPVSVLINFDKVAKDFPLKLDSYQVLIYNIKRLGIKSFRKLKSKLQK